MASIKKGTEVDIIPQYLDDRPEMKYINRYVIKGVCASGPEAWLRLGTELFDDKDITTLHAIRSDATTSNTCCSRMLKLWLERQPEASWRRLIIALKQIWMNKLASEIEELLSSSEEVATTRTTDGSSEKLPSVPQQQPLLTTDILRAEFGRLIMTICRILGQSPDWKSKLMACKEFCTYLKTSDNANAPLFSEERLTEIKNSEDFNRFFEIVNQHLSWDEDFILTEIIDECDSDEAKQEFKKYKRKMGISKALEIISSAESSLPQGFEKFCVIIDKPYKKLTVEEYEEIKTFIFTNLDTHRYVTNKYIRVLYDSLHIEWEVTTQATPHMCKMAYDQQAVFTKNLYIFLQIGKQVIINKRIEQLSMCSIDHELDWMNPLIQKRDSKFTHFVAIDFGTYGCGMALSTNVDPDNTHVYSNWVQSKMDVKCPTALLLNDDGEFEAFGQNAVYMYQTKHRLCRPHKADQYYFFYRFKMCLYNKKLTKDVKIKAQNGRELPAIRVISITLEHLKKLILQQIDQQFMHPNRRIQWILTVPAIWSEAAKQIMRFAAKEAGLGKGENDILKLALEPEAAAMFCLKEILSASKPSKDEVNHYLLADCGGGTVDIVAHRLTRKSTGEISIEEIHKAHGGPYGGFAVNDEFERMLQGVFQLKTEEMRDIQVKHPQKWTKVIAMDFEITKYMVDPNIASATFTIPMPPGVCTSIENLKGKPIAKLVEEYTLHKLEWDEDNYELVIPFSTMSGLFLPIVAKISTVIEDVLQKPECKHVNRILLVGGFAESSLLFSEFKQKFASVKIMVNRSSSPWLSVLKGAIVYARHNLIHSRKMCQTLGIGVYDTFKPGVHRESYKTVIDGRELCKNRFSKFVEVNESVKVSDVIEHNYYPVTNEVKKSEISIYGSQRNVEYIDDDGCYQIGVITVDLPEYKTGVSRNIRVIMQVSGTEITVSAYSCTETPQSLPLHLDLIVDKYAVKENDDN